MNKNILLITGGTGGHVIPAENLALYLKNKNINCNLLTDNRGYKYTKKFKNKTYIVKSSNLNGNLLKKIFGLLILIIGFFQSFFIIFLLKPNKVISFGSYASFFPLISCLLLKPFFKIEIYIHEQNSILGRTNKFFLRYCAKLFLNFDISSKIHSKYKNKIHVVGSPEKNFKKIESNRKNFINKKFNIFIFGGSQGSDFISNFSLNVIKKIEEDKIINANYIIQCPSYLIEKISTKLKKIKSKIIIKDYFDNIDDILQTTSLAISRAGAGSITDLIHYRVPSILIPLPSAKDNHQEHNAHIMSDHNLAIILNQNLNESIKAKNYIYQIYNKSNENQINIGFDKIKVRNSNSLIYKLITNEK